MRFRPCLLLLASVSAFAQDYTVRTVAGTGATEKSGTQPTGVSATMAPISPTDTAVDAAGNIYIADVQTVQKISSGIITTVATSTSVKNVAVDPSGNVYFTDPTNDYICKVVSGACTIVAGTKGVSSFTGDNGPATKATLHTPGAITFDSAGNLYIADMGNYRVRKVSGGGTITTVAGSGSANCNAVTGDGGAATSAAFCSISGLAVDSSGSLYISDGPVSRVRKVSGGIITSVAGGTGTWLPVDGVSATGPVLRTPAGLSVDAAGNLYIADSMANRIRRVSGGTITTIAGAGTTTGFSGDNGPATEANLAYPTSVTLSGSNLYIADADFYRIRELVSATGALPSITPNGVVPLYSNLTTIQPGQWVSIYGQNLGPNPGVSWNADFPTTLGGTSVTINGKPAYLWYVSSSQINLQSPADTTTGPVLVVVTTPAGSTTWDVTLSPVAPALLLLDGKHVTGIISRMDGSGVYGGGTYDIIGPAGTSLGYPTVPAKVGDIISLFAGGIGPTSPAVPPGQIYSGAAPISGFLSLKIGGTTVPALFAGLIGAGLYQINFQLPIGLGVGDVPIQMSVNYLNNSATSPSLAVISLQDPVPPPGGVQSLTLSRSSASDLSYVTGQINLYSAAPSGGETVTLYSSSSAAPLPASIPIATGNSFTSFSFTPAAVTSSQPVTITASYNGTSASATVTVNPPATACSTLAGPWIVDESGSENESLTAAGQTSVATGAIDGYGNVTITQTGCNFQFQPYGEQGLTGTGLTADQLAQLTRNGVVAGTSVTITGELALLSSIEASEEQANPGLVVNSATVGVNSMTGTGQVLGNVMTVNETGQFTASGSFSYEGENGSFSLNITTSSTATFSWDGTTQQRPDVRRMSGSSPNPNIEVRVSPGQSRAAEALRKAFAKALIFANR